MKYYVYISDAKVDMLLGQLPDRERQKLAVELKVNLAVLSMKVTGTGTVGPIDHRVNRLEAVVRHLRATKDVGDFLSESSYISDTLDISYCTQGPESSFVAFVGRRGSRYLMMGGSAKHLLGGASDLPSLGHSSSL